MDDPAVMKTLPRSSSRRPAQHGQGLAEYALLLALIAVVVIAALTFAGGGINGLLNSINSGLNFGGPAATAPANPGPANNGNGNANGQNGGQGTGNGGAPNGNGGGNGGNGNGGGNRP